MKILVLSDSHSTLSFMRRCIDSVKPDTILHLGDYYDDGQAIREEYPHIGFYQVPGNCDRYRCPPYASEVLVLPLGGVRVYLTHGHRHHVKQGLGPLLADARISGAAAVLYGHTHTAYCCREGDGLWVLNPGSCGYFGGSAGLMELRDGKIESCRVLRQDDLEAFT